MTVAGCHGPRSLGEEEERSVNVVPLFEPGITVAVIPAIPPDLRARDRGEMTDVTVTNHRADSSANEDLTTLARHGADAFGYKANLRIDRSLASLTRPSPTISVCVTPRWPSTSPPTRSSRLSGSSST
jgi:hypothetical protein